MNRDSFITRGFNSYFKWFKSHEIEQACSKSSFISLAIL